MVSFSFTEEKTVQRYMRSIILLLSFGVLLITSCTKEATTYAKLPAPEVRSYLLKTTSGDTAGLFTIGTTKEEKTIITVDILKKSNIYGTKYAATVCFADNNNCYVSLADVNAVIGYSETVDVKEQATGKMLKADELFKKTGYRLMVRNGNEVIASGIIR
jgi:hypothetical protein